MDTTLEIFNGVRARSHELLGRVASASEVVPLPLNGFLGVRDLA